MPQSVSGIKIDTSGKKKTSTRKKSDFIVVKKEEAPEPKKAAKPKPKVPKLHAVKPQVSAYNRAGSWIVEWEHQQKKKRRKRNRRFCCCFLLFLVACGVFAVLEYLHYTFFFHKKISKIAFAVEGENAFELTVLNPEEVRGYVIAIKGEPSDGLCETNEVVSLDPDGVETFCLSACDVETQMEWEKDNNFQRQCNLYTPKPGQYFVASKYDAWAIVAGTPMTEEYVWSLPEPPDKYTLGWMFLLVSGVCTMSALFRRFF
jgi:hypothetical protein